MSKNSLPNRLKDFLIKESTEDLRELSKSLGKRNSTNENIERAFIILVDEKIT